MVIKEGIVPNTGIAFMSDESPVCLPRFWADVTGCSSWVCTVVGDVSSPKGSEKYAFKACSSSSTVEAAAKLASLAGHLLSGVLVIAGRLIAGFWLVIVVGVDGGGAEEDGKQTGKNERVQDRFVALAHVDGP